MLAKPLNEVVAASSGFPDGNIQVTEIYATYGGVLSERAEIEMRQQRPDFVRQYGVNIVLVGNHLNDDMQPTNDPETPYKQYLKCHSREQGWFYNGTPGHDMSWKVINIDKDEDGNPIMDTYTLLEPNTEEDENGRIGDQPKGNAIETPTGQIAANTDLGRFISQLQEKGLDVQRIPVAHPFTGLAPLTMRITQESQSANIKGQQVTWKRMVVNEVLSWPYDQAEPATKSTKPATAKNAPAVKGKAPAPKPAAPKPAAKPAPAPVQSSEEVELSEDDVATATAVLDKAITAKTTGTKVAIVFKGLLSKVAADEGVDVNSVLNAIAAHGEDGITLSNGRVVKKVGNSYQIV